MPKRKCKFNETLAKKYSSFKQGRNEFEGECLVCPPGTYVSIANKGKSIVIMFIHLIMYKNIIVDFSMNGIFTTYTYD